MSISLLIACALFFFCPTQYLYYGLIILVGIYALLAEETMFILAFFAILLLGILIVFAVLAPTVGFFWQVWDLITPGGPNMNWSVQLPQYFYAILPAGIGIMLLMLGFVGLFYHGWADQYLAAGFAKAMIAIFFIFTLLNCLFVSVTLYEALSTTPWTLLVWECIFIWLPFFTLAFILYSLSGRFFDSEDYSEREYRNKVDRLEQRERARTKAQTQKGRRSR